VRRASCVVCGGTSMTALLNHPAVLFVVVFLLLWLAARLGSACADLLPPLPSVDPENFNLVLGATLTLLGLIIGFTFSMAVGRYDQRKNYEEEEANAIGTEYLRLDLLPAADAASLRVQLRAYLDERIAYYASRDPRLLGETAARTAKLQSSLWSGATASAERDAVTALALSGMNDVLNRQGYTEAAWLNRVPVAAWILLLVIALLSNLLVGYRMREKSVLLLFILPAVLSVSFFLVADIDSPRGGVIHVHPQNLEMLAESLRPH
jgi:hypothetical protein